MVNVARPLVGAYTEVQVTVFERNVVDRLDAPQQVAAGQHRANQRLAFR